MILRSKLALSFFGFFDLGSSFADEVAEVVKFGPSSEAGLFDFDFTDDWCMEGEDLLDPNTPTGNFANDKCRIVFGMNSDDYTLEDLDACLVPFFDTLVNTDSVTYVERDIFMG